MAVVVIVKHCKAKVTNKQTGVTMIMHMTMMMMINHMMRTKNNDVDEVDDGDDDEL